MVQALSSKDKTTTWTKSSNHQKAIPRVAILCRVSSTKQEKDGTIENQRYLCKELYKAHFTDQDHVYVGEYCDEAYNLEAKDESRNFWKLMAAVQSGEVNTIITVNTDRIFRGATKKLNGEISDIFTLAQLMLITTSQKKRYDPTDITGRMVDGFLQELGPTAKLQMTASLQTARRKQLTQDEKWRLSVVPYGYRLKIIGSGKHKEYLYNIVEEEAKVIRDIFRLYVGEKTEFLPSPEGQRPLGVKLIANLLNRLNVDRSAWVETTPEGHQSGNIWLAPSINRMIRNPLYKGELIVIFNESKAGSSYNAEAVAQKIPIPPIVDNDLFDRVQRVREKKATKTLEIMSTGAQHKNWLHRKIHCPSCKELMRGFTSIHKDRYYGCPKAGTVNRSGKKHRTFRALDIEEMIGTFLMKALRTGILYKELYRGLSLADDGHHRMTQLSNELEMLKGKRKKLDSELTNLTDYLIKGIIPESQYVVHKERITSDLSKDDGRIRFLVDEIQHLQNNRSSVLVKVDELKNKFEQALNEPEFVTNVLREMALELVNFIEITEISPINLSTLDIEQIKMIYEKGLVIRKQLMEAGWTDRKIAKHLGKCGRKSALNFKLSIHWITGETTEIDPTTGLDFL
jgi:DNA invertase Pin-like site-specific DNA recombinase